MKKTDYREITWFEMKPDVYGGKNRDEHIPLWWGYSEGDMDSDKLPEPLILDPKSFPPGTKITIKEPVCPKCNEIYSICMSRSNNPAYNSCDFDWKGWTEDQYS